LSSYLPTVFSLRLPQLNFSMATERVNKLTTAPTTDYISTPKPFDNSQGHTFSDESDMTDSTQANMDEVSAGLGGGIGGSFGDGFGDGFGNEFGNSFGNSFGTSFDSDLSNDFGGDIGNSFGSDLTNSFGSDLTNSFDSDLPNDFGGDLPDLTSMLMHGMIQSDTDSKHGY
jgi:hypothetical protein